MDRDDATELLEKVDEYLAAVDELQTHSVLMMRDVGGQLPSVDELSRAREASQLVVFRRQDLRRARNRLLTSRDACSQLVDASDVQTLRKVAVVA